MASSRRRTLDQRLFSDGPKRILSIDGGGGRAILAAGMLAEIERRLARRCGRPDFRLCEYFDLIGGASTGAVLAAGLAMGKTCAECAELYREIAPEPGAAKGKSAVRAPRYDAGKLEAALSRALGDYELSSPALKTGLALFARRADSGAGWTLTNHPRSPQWDGSADGAPPTKRLMIRKLVQACLGGPAFGEALKLNLAQDGSGVANAEGTFSDAAGGAINNPSLQLLKVATMKSYGFAWPAAEDRLLMLSAGAGYWRGSEGALDEAARAADALSTMMNEASLQAVATLQGFSRTPRPWRIDAEIGDMRGDQISPFPILTFQRLDVRLEPGHLTTLGVEMADADIARLRGFAIDDPALVNRLHEIGLRRGQYYFRNWAGHTPGDWDTAILPPRFDPAFFAERPLGDPRNRLDALGRFFKPTPSSD